MYRYGTVEVYERRKYIGPKTPHKGLESIFDWEGNRSQFDWWWSIRRLDGSKFELANGSRTDTIFSYDAFGRESGVYDEPEDNLASLFTFMREYCTDTLTENDFVAIEDTTPMFFDHYHRDDW